MGRMIQQWLLKNNYFLFPALFIAFCLSCANTNSGQTEVSDSNPFVGEWVGVQEITADRGRIIRATREVRLKVFPYGCGELYLGGFIFSRRLVPGKKMIFNYPKIFFSAENKQCLAIRINYGTVFCFEDQNHVIMEGRSENSYFTDYGRVILKKKQP